MPRMTASARRAALSISLRTICTSAPALPKGFLKNSFDSLLVVRMNFLKRIRPLQIGRVSQASYVGGTVIEPLSVPVDHRNQVRDILGNQLEKFRALPQLLVGPLPLHRVTNDAREHFAVEFTLHQVILRAFAH